MLAFEVAHIGIHIFPIGLAIGSSGESDYLLCQTLGIAFVTEIILATDAVGNGSDIRAGVFVQVFVVANSHIRSGNNVLCLIDSIAHRALAVADESDAVATLHHRWDRLDEIKNAVVEIGSTEITDALLVALQVVQTFGFAGFKYGEQVAQQKVLVGQSFLWGG